MTLSVLGWIYFFCFLLGLGYTFISMFLSHGHGGGDLHADLPGDVHADIHAATPTDLHHELARTVAHSHHPIAEFHIRGGGDSGQPDFPIFSPLTLALSVTVFGGVGTILNLLKMPSYVTLPASAVAGALGWAGAFYFFFKFFRFAQSSSEAVVDQLIGKEANVTLTIPTGGLGEINYIARGTQYNAPARSESGASLHAGTSVVIVKIDDSVCT